jgi:alkaline phosphatase D
MEFVFCDSFDFWILLFVIYNTLMLRKLCLGLLIFFLASHLMQASEKNHCVVVLSMDGFRWDYSALFHTPNLDRVAKNGCKAVSLKPCYPSKTFPNHYAIATGLYPDHNGIVQNSFYDPKLDRVFRMGDRMAVEDSVFWEGEAIWETAEQQGVQTAAYFWVGTESNERYRPEMRKFYESGFPYEQQIDTVIHWLSLPSETRPELVLFYFDEPDKTSHDTGPVSKETGEVVKRLDRLVGHLVRELKRVEKKCNLEVDLIILSDHGMGNVPEGQQVFLEDVIDLKKIRHINSGSPVVNLDPEPSYLGEACNKLRSTPHLKVWKREELPVAYHYGTHQRIPALVVEADSGWGLEIRHKAQGTRLKGGYSLGVHGYDPANTDMHGIFYAEGPSFKKGFVQPTFENVNIYELLARLLNIKPAKTDGNLNVVKGMLKDH